jgi:uncharacterized Zn finger protein
MTDADHPARVGATCPSCSPTAATEHEVLSTGGQYTVRCTECSHVHKTSVGDSTVRRDVIVSQDGDSLSTDVAVPPGEPLSVGDEFVVESDAGVFVVRVTSLEVGTEQRAESATAEDVRTVWTRDVGNVTVDATVHPPAGGPHDETRGVDLHVPGDHEFVVGEHTSLGEVDIEVEQIRLRETVSGYDHYQLERPGDAALAKDVLRLYARDRSGRVDFRTNWSR